jgi:hypothetical protein
MTPLMCKSCQLTLPVLSASSSPATVRRAATSLGFAPSASVAVSVPSSLPLMNQRSFFAIGSSVNASVSVGSAAAVVEKRQSV